VQAYTHKIFMNVALNYDVDGVHMDFVRYPGATWGYTATSLAQYKHDNRRDRDARARGCSLQAWRRDRVTAFVRDLHADLQQRKPSVKLSAALICFGGGPGKRRGLEIYTSAYRSVFQDWREWLANG